MVRVCELLREPHPQAKGKRPTEAKPSTVGLLQRRLDEGPFPTVTPLLHVVEERGGGP